MAPDERDWLVSRLMAARRAVREALRAENRDALALARREVDAVKIALGERGPVWWTDGARDVNRHMAHKSVYAEWLASLADTERGKLSPATGL